MIKIELTNNRVTVAGHAGAGPPGTDIVCASISTLLQTLEASLKELTKDQIKSDLRQGYAVIEYRPEDLSEQSKLLIESFFIGVNGVADAAPEYVTVIEGNGAEPNISGENDKAAREIREDREENNEQKNQRDETLLLQFATLC